MRRAIAAAIVFGLIILLVLIAEVRKQEREDCRYQCLFAKYEGTDFVDGMDAAIACRVCEGVKRGLVKDCPACSYPK